MDGNEEWIFWFFRECLRDDIIPHAIKWFTGEAQMEDSDEDEDDEDEEDDDEDDEVCFILPAYQMRCSCGRKQQCFPLACKLVGGALWLSRSHACHTWHFQEQSLSCAVHDGLVQQGGIRVCTTGRWQNLIHVKVLNLSPSNSMQQFSRMLLNFV